MATATTACDKGILSYFTLFFFLLWLPEIKEIMKKLLWLNVYVTQFSNSVSLLVLYSIYEVKCCSQKFAIIFELKRIEILTAFLYLKILSHF